MFAINSETVLRIPAPIVQLIIVALIPILTGLLTKITVPGVVKGLLTLLFSTLTAFISAGVVDGGDSVFTAHTAYNAVINFGIAVVAYLGIYKQANITSSTVNGKLGPNTGMGVKPNLGEPPAH